MKNYGVGWGVSPFSEVTAHKLRTFPAALLNAGFGMAACSSSEITSLQSPYVPWTFVKTVPCVLSRQVIWSLLFTGKQTKYNFVCFPHSMHNMPPLGLEYDHSPQPSAEVNGSFSILTSQRGLVIDSRKGQEIFLFSTWFTPARVPPNFLFSEYWPLPSSAEVKNTWSCTFSTAYVFRIEG
jgi:hypothetical protein